MDNQQNQPGSPMPGNDIRVQNAGSSDAPAGTGASNSLEGGAAASARKASRSQGAQGAASDQASNSGDQTDATSAQGSSDEGGQPSSKLLDTALQSGKKWIEDSGVLNSVTGLPQNVKEWGTKAATRVGDLTTTQKIVGGALLAVGIGYIATRKGKGKSSGSTKSASEYGAKGSSYGRRNYGYQAPDAANSRRVSSGSGRTDSGSPYGNHGNSYGSTSGSGSYASGSSYNPGTGAGASPASSHSADKGTGFGGSSPKGGDSGSRTSESSYRPGKSNDFDSVE